MSETGQERIELQRHGAIALITIDNPARRNALNLPMREWLYDALTTSAADQSCRVIVLTGRGEHFCAGGDINSMANIAAHEGRERVRKIGRIATAIVAAEKPVLAAIEGAAAGAGLSLAAACDIVVAARDAKFSCPFNKLGLAPDLALTHTLPARVGLGRAKLIMLGAKPFDAVEGERIGLVEVLTERGHALETAMQMAAEFALAAPLVNGAIKSLTARLPNSLAAHLAGEADAQGVLFASADLDEGVRAFLEKRTPRFEGK